MKVAAAFVLLLLAAGPASAADPGTAPAAIDRSRLDEKITLSLKDAKLRDVLERLAVLLGLTPIFQPEVDALPPISLEVKNVSVSDVLGRIQESRTVTIRIENNRMFVSRAGQPLSGAPGEPDDEALDRALLADTDLPRRTAGPIPKRENSLVEFRPEDPGRAATVWHLAALGAVTLPGCAGPLRVQPLDRDLLDGELLLAVAGTAPSPAPGRVVSAGHSFRVADCPFPILVSEVAPEKGPGLQPAPVPVDGQYLFRLRLLEIDAHEEKVLSAPRITTAGSEPWNVRSGSKRKAASGTFLESQIRIAGAVLDVTGDKALVAVAGTVTRDVLAADGSLQTIRVAQIAESMRLVFGEAGRVTISPTYGRGRSALVLELTLEKVNR